MNTTISAFVDNGLEWLRQKDLLRRPDPKMPVEMLDTTRENRNDWKPWKPIPSSVTDNDLIQIETQIGHKLPNSYKEFLKYKHFYEVHTIKGYETFQHLIHEWKPFLLKKLFHSELKEFMLEQGYIWFGGYEDWGFLCFDTNKNANDNEYPIVLIDHETIDQHQVVYPDFLHCLQVNTVTV